MIVFLMLVNLFLPDGIDVHAANCSAQHICYILTFFLRIINPFSFLYNNSWQIKQQMKRYAEKSFFFMQKK